METRRTWTADDSNWHGTAAGTNGELTVRRVPRGQVGLTAVAEIRAFLERAERGQAEIADGGEELGKPLVVVTERTQDVVRRVWLTRDNHPRVVRSETTVISPNARRPIVTTSTTTTWRVLPRTPQALADVEIPSHATRVP